MHVFLCHASEDKPLVRTLCSRLKKDGFSPWLDEDELLPGQDWQIEIKKAVRAAGAVVVCLSPRSTTKEGYLQRELRYVLDIADEKPEGTIFVIPVKFENCEIPERLSSLQWVQYSDEGYDRLRRALQLRAARHAAG